MATKEKIERCTIAYRMREEGKTFKEIGVVLGVTGHHASLLYKNYHKVIKEGVTNNK